MFWGMKLALILALVAAPAFAAPAFAECPMPADTGPEMLNLIEKAQAAENFKEGRSVSDEMWQVWLRAPDEVAQSVLDAGLVRRNAYDFAGAFKEFDRLASYCPEFAEGFNQRAYIHFLREDYAKALPDLDIALRLNPYHIAAQSGRALTLMNLGRLDEARAQLLIAVENNPWLSEAALLAEGAPLGPKGKDI